MGRKTLIALIIIVVLVLLFTGFALFGYFYMDKQAKKWDVIKPIIEGKLKEATMLAHSMSEDDYMQFIVGSWVLANIETDQIKKLMNLSEDSAKEKEATKKTISKISKAQKKTRISFMISSSDPKNGYSDPNFFLFKKLLLSDPSETTLNEIERSVVEDFYKKHKTGEDVLKRKTNGGKGELTFVENAIKNVKEVFKQYVVAPTS